MFESLLRDYAGTPRFKEFQEKIYLDAHDADYVINNFIELINKWLYEDASNVRRWISPKICYT